MAKVSLAHDHPKKRRQMMNPRFLNGNRMIGVLCAVCAIALTYKYFPGLENSHWYGGFVMKMKVMSAACNPTCGLRALAGRW